jgi:hypothetical protein
VHTAGAAAISAKDQERAKLLHHKTVMKFSTVDRWEQQQAEVKAHFTICVMSLA